MYGQELINAMVGYSSMRAASRDLDIPISTLRGRLKRAQEQDYESYIPDHAFSPDHHHLPDTHVGPDGVATRDAAEEHTHGVKRYILTSAQNNTEVHKDFLRNLEAFADHIDAQIMVSFCTYDKQGYRGVVPKGERSLGQREVWWDKAIEPYVVNDRVKLAKRLAFCGELDILATAKRPLSGLDSYCGRSSVIVPHNKFEFRCVEARQKHMPKEMHTTGSVTHRNFIQRKTGQLASFHHVLGALMVEVDQDGYFWVHHINADDDGGFYWLDCRVQDGQVHENAEGVEALILGDIHYAQSSWGVRNRIVETLIPEVKPARVLVHDLIDFYARNHHSRDDPEHNARITGANYPLSIESELRGAFAFLRLIAREVEEVVVVPSNHHDAFRKWVHETDWRDDLINAELYLAAAREMVRVSKIPHHRRLNLLEWAYYNYFRLPNLSIRNPVFLDPDNSYEVKGIECGMHGHVGPSGSRGSPANISRLPFKTFTGHTHSPSIRDGCYTVGTLSHLNMNYTRGPSKWMHACGVIYPNGKRAFLFLKKGGAMNALQWRAKNGEGAVVNGTDDSDSV